MRLVLASNNAKKLAELQALFSTQGYELVTQASLGIAEAEEPHVSFVENALAKARHAARASGAAAIADDSGLCVDALGGAPGVASAHFAPVVVPEDAGGREQRRLLQDSANNLLLLQRLHGQSRRSARFVSTLVALRHADDPEPLIATGHWRGEILTEPRGSAGFGYDPLVFIPELGATVAELPAQIKAQHSHRALAVREMLALMQAWW